MNNVLMFLLKNLRRISAYIDIDVDNKTSSFQLSGSNNYNIDINGTVYNIKQDKIYYFSYQQVLTLLKFIQT